MSKKGCSGSHISLYNAFSCFHESCSSKAIRVIVIKSVTRCDVQRSPCDQDKYQTRAATCLNNRQTVCVFVCVCALVYRICIHIYRILKNVKKCQEHNYSSYKQPIVSNNIDNRLVIKINNIVQFDCLKSDFQSVISSLIRAATDNDSNSFFCPINSQKPKDYSFTIINGKKQILTFRKLHPASVIN